MEENARRSRGLPAQTLPRLARMLMPLALAVATTSGCRNGTHEPGAEASLTLIATDTLVSTGSGLIGGVYDLAVSPTGDVYVADFGYKHVLVVGPDGNVRRTIGREGSGPGEFEMPFAIHAGADSVWVLDAISGRVQVFDSAGVVVRTYGVGLPAQVGPGRDFADDGSLAAATEGADSSMVVVLDPAGGVVRHSGVPIVPPVASYDFRAIKSELRAGHVPDVFRNRALLAWGPGQSLYIALLADPDVRRYDSAGNLLWEQALADPVFSRIREDVIRKNIEERTPSRIHQLRCLTDATVVDGDLWLLLNTEDEHVGVALVLRSEDGSIRRRLTFPHLPNTGYFGVDAARRRLYMAPRGEASVLVFQLPTL